MKKLIPVSLTAVVFFLAATFAKADNIIANSNVVSSGMGIVKVMANSSLAVHSITVYDDNGVSLYELNDMKSGSFKKIDFSRVPDGTYYIKVENKRSIETTRIQKIDGSVSVSENATLFIKPIFRKRGKILDVFLDNPYKKDVEISVYNQTGSLVNTVHSEDSAIAKGFDFSKRLHGKYKVVLSMDDYVFNTDFDL